MKQLIIIAVLALVSHAAMAQDTRKSSDKVETMTKFEYATIEGITDSIPPIIYDHASTPPEFPGGIGAMDKFIRDNLNYPAEKWKRHKKHGTAKVSVITPYIGRCIVRKDGKAIFVKKKGVNINEFDKELARVVSIMPKWKPARLKGHAVDAITYIDTKLIHPYYSVPYSAVPLVRQSRDAAKSVDKHYNYGIGKAVADSAIKRIVPTLKEGWDEIEISLAGSRLLTTVGKYDEAKELLGNTVDIYHWYCFSEKPNPLTGKYMKDLIVSKDSYDPKTDLEATITLAAISDMAEGREKSAKAYDRAIDLIDIFLLEGMGDTDLSQQELQQTWDLLQEKAEIVDDATARGISLNPNERYNIEHEMMLGARNREIDKRIDEGKISNARVIQITKQLNEMERKRQERQTNKNSLKLYQLRAMLIGLRDGHDAEKRYIAQLASGEMTGRKIAKRMAEWSKKTAEPVCDRNRMLEALVLYAPLNVTGEKTEANKTAAEAFYDTRRKLKDVYPLKWLWK